jgi:histidine phosphotransferase ChpT
MNTELDKRVMELMCARLCHDLIGPVAAINNGVELVRDFGDEMQGEALELIGESASRASKLLQFYRVAFGSARAADGSGIGIDEARRRALEALSSERVTIYWPEGDSPQAAGLLRLTVKLALNLLLLAVETLPGAGTVEVAITPGDPGEVRMTARKEGIVMPDDIAAVLEGEVSEEDLTPQTVQAFFTRSLAESVSRGLDRKADPDAITFFIELNA